LRKQVTDSVHDGIPVNQLITEPPKRTKKIVTGEVRQNYVFGEQNAKAKAKAYNTCRAPQVTYRDFRGAGHVTGQASLGRRP